MANFRLTLSLLFLLITTNIYAQSSARREIKEYQVTIKTQKGSVKGLLQQVNEESIDVITSRGARSVSAAAIKEIKIKFDKNRHIQVFEGMSDTGVEMIAISLDDDRSNIRRGELGAPIYDNPEDERTLTDAAGQALLGTATVATALAADQVTRLIYKPSIEAFKVNYEVEKFKDIRKQLALYSIATQASPSYAKELQEQLQQTLKVKKMDVKDNPFRNKELIKKR
ncbi:hypothetical protein [Sphingobacterium sp. UBA6645]|uniref:hypothetical protein n=1 Tax=Sphingobacterium sp. UBA6645 TaxID=1947511 RepID=UPI0025D0083F|nr:hypothetical protein [Sphingobacterium sp. UBA6645]